MTVARALLVALVLLLALPAGSAFAQRPLLPPETLAQEPTAPPETLPPDTLPGDEDDEELGEEIPEEQEQTPDEPEPAPRPDPPADPPPPTERALPRTGSNPLPLMALAAILLSCGLALRERVRA